MLSFLKDRLTDPSTKKGALAVVVWLLARFGLAGDEALVGMVDGTLTVVLGWLVYATKEEKKD
jgi:hypothetical protein